MRRASIAWTALLLLLLAARVPSLVQPAGGDQGLYTYAGQRVLNGGVPYLDTWDQKPPAISFIYALLWKVWPHESIVPAADMVVAAAVALLLVLLGRRTFGTNVGSGAACVFLLFGDPSLNRLGGLYVRAQCETFIALAIVGAFVLLASPRRTRMHVFVSGILLGLSFWLKYNTLIYAVPLVLAVWHWRPGPASNSGRPAASTRADLIALGLGNAVVAASFLGYFASQGALTDLYLATIEYNLQYSRETYSGVLSAIGYLGRFPITRAGIEMIWFLGGLGVLLLVIRRPLARPAAVAVAWVAAAVLSIAVNGARDLPQYFVQAHPALAFAAAAGFATLAHRGTLVRVACAVLVIVGLARVGHETPVWGVRLGGLPQVIDNLRGDWSMMRGKIDRPTYLTRFQSNKYSAPAIAAMTNYLTSTTLTTDHALVFGFLGGSINAFAERASPSRFFWSRPVIVEFAADHPGYGSAGLLADLQARPPAVVMLQRQDWNSAVDSSADSFDFFMSHRQLSEWLQTRYQLDSNTPVFAVYRRVR